MAGQEWGTGYGVCELILTLARPNTCTTPDFNQPGEGRVREFMRGMRLAQVEWKFRPSELHYPLPEIQQLVKMSDFAYAVEDILAGRNAQFDHWVRELFV